MSDMIPYHNPKGVAFPNAGHRHELGVIYVARYADGFYDFKRFMHSLARTTDKAFGLMVVYKGFPSATTAYEGWHPTAVQCHTLADTCACLMPDHGYDLTAYRVGAEMAGNPTLAFFNTGSEILHPDWNTAFMEALKVDKVGAVGATGSWESFQRGWLRRLLFPAFPNPHLRTNAFAMRRDLFLRVWPHRRFRTKRGCYLWESGYNGFTRKLWALGYKVAVVATPRVMLDWPAWQFSAYRSERWSSERPLVADSQTRRFDELTPEGKKLLSRITWGTE